MRFSVIMPVYLGDYPTRGANPEYKFKRAVDTYLLQEFKDSELIIISDGCEKAKGIWAEHFADNNKIKFEMISKQELFSGKVRQQGMEIAEGELICYLDADDIFGVKHLQIISDNFDTTAVDWVYYNDYIVVNEHLNILERGVRPIHLYIGTSCIAHKRSIGAVWGNHYEHDWAFINDYLKKYPSAKIPTPQYYVCHVPYIYDF